MTIVVSAPPPLLGDHDFEVAPLVGMFGARGEVTRTEMVGNIQDEADVSGLLGGVQPPLPRVERGPDPTYVVSLARVGATSRTTERLIGPS